MMRYHSHRVPNKNDEVLLAQSTEVRLGGEGTPFADSMAGTVFQSHGVPCNAAAGCGPIHPPSPSLVFNRFFGIDFLGDP